MSITFAAKELAAKYGHYDEEGWSQNYLEFKTDGTFQTVDSSSGGMGSMGSRIKGHWQLSVRWKIITSIK